MNSTTKGGILLIASTIFIALINYLLSITLSWVLTPTQFGAIGVSQSLIFVGSWFLIAGFPWVATQAIAKVGPDQIEQTFPLLNGVLWANSGLGILVAAALWLAVRFGWLPLGDEYYMLVSWVALIIVLLAVRLAIAAVPQGRLQFAQLSLIALVEVITQFVSALTLVYFDFGAEGALAGFALGTALSLAVALWFVRDLRFWQRPRLDSTLLQALRPALPLLLANMSGVLLVNVDLLALKLLWGGQSDQIGHYQVAAVLARIPYYVSQSASAILFPLVARHAAHSAEADQTSRQSFERVVSLVFALNLVLMAAPQATIAFFFPALYLAVAPTLRLLTLAIGLIILAQTLATICQARNQSRSAALVLPVAALVQMVAVFWLIPRFGVEGAALSSCVAGAIALFGMIGVTRRAFPSLLRLSSQWWLRQAAAFVLLMVVIGALPLLGRVLTALWIAGWGCTGWR